MKRIQNRITRSVVFCQVDDSIEVVLKQMIDLNVSSVLIIDESEMIVGIVTERDVVRKLILLDKDDKLESTALSFMTRPVKFVYLNHLSKDIKSALTDHNIRHFPVLRQGGTGHRDDLEGILTVTDLAKAYVGQQDKRKKKPQEKDNLAQKELLLMCKNGIRRSTLKTLLEQLGLKVLDPEPKDMQEQVELFVDRKLPIIFDLDSFSGTQEAQGLISKVIQNRGDVIFITKLVATAQSFKSALKQPHHHIMLKPLDLAFLAFLTT